MHIQQQISENGGAFYIETEGKRVAEINFRLKPELLIIDHTEVDKSLSGQHLGHDLVDSTVEYARANHLKIIPIYPFAKAIFEKKKDTYRDVL